MRIASHRHRISHRRIWAKNEKSHFLSSRDEACCSVRLTRRPLVHLSHLFLSFACCGHTKCPPPCECHSRKRRLLFRRRTQPIFYQVTSSNTTMACVSAATSVVCRAPAPASGRAASARRAAVTGRKAMSTRPAAAPGEAATDLNGARLDIPTSTYRALYSTESLACFEMIPRVRARTWLTPVA